MTTTNLGMTVPTVGADTDNWGNDLNNDLALIDVFAGRLMPGAEVTLASAATTDIGNAASTAVVISGTTAVTSFGTVANCIRFVRFSAALVLTHNATSLILLGGAGRTTAAGDCGIYQSDASGNWREKAYASAAYNPGIHTGTGAYVHAASPALVAPTADSLALNGASLGGYRLAVNGGITTNGNLNSSGGSVTIPGATFGADTGNGASLTITGWGYSNQISIGGLSSTNGNGVQVVCVANGVVLTNSASSWSALSDERMKTDLVPITDAATKTKTLRAVTGRYISDPAGTSRAFMVAQDVQAVLPEAVSEDAQSGMLQLAATDTIPLLLAAIKELITRVEALEAAP